MTTDNKRFDILEDANCFLGERKVIEIEVVDANGAPYSLTGKTLEWILRRGRRGLLELTKISGAGITVIAGTGADTRARIVIDALDTVDALDNLLVEPGRCFHTLRQTNAADEAVLSYGDFVWQLAATR